MNCVNFSFRDNKECKLKLLISDLEKFDHEMTDCILFLT